MREKLIALSLAKKGDWNEMYQVVKIDHQLKSIDEKAAHQLVNQLDCNVITIVDENYPQAWREMTKPPFVVYLKGCDQQLTTKTVTIVGGKTMTEYSKKAVKRLMARLPKEINVATGFEQGVEAFANEHAKRRIVCLASGFYADEIYEKQPAYQLLNENDLLISELPPHSKFSLQAYYRSYHLLMELSSVVCVFGMPSFDLRLKYLNHLTEVGKTVFVLPDQLNRHTAGGLMLLNQGAKCLIDKGAILNCFDD